VGATGLNRDLFRVSNHRGTAVPSVVVAGRLEA
jgi:hypothetical protein